MGDAVISIKDVSKLYRVFQNERGRLVHALWPRYQIGMREVWALRNVSFEIGRGEAVGVIGRNGGGKSTLLEILTGTLAPTAGEVEVKGRVSALLELGSGFHPDYSGRDNVILNGLLLGLDRQEILERFREIETFAEIGDAIDRPVRTYSSGMMMRLAFAVQVLCDPDILIIDEALSVGDFFFQQKCLGFIRKLCERGVTLLFVSHDMGTVRDLCSRVIYLKSGELAFDGKTSDGIPLFFNEKVGPPVRPQFPDNALRTQATIAPVGTFENFKTKAVWAAPTAPEDAKGRLLGVAFLDEEGQPTTTFRIGETIRVSVAYVEDKNYINHISVGLTNKHGQLTTMSGSSLLKMDLETSADGQYIVYFDLDLTLMVEPGGYSVLVTLGYDTGANTGERLDQSPPLGPIHVMWDYSRDKAPFIGQCGLPATAAFRLETL